MNEVPVYYNEKILKIDSDSSSFQTEGNKFNLKFSS